jgi:hypothetical protein
MGVAMSVPFPRTTPPDPPQPPSPLLDQRAARVLFEARQAEGAVGYRLAAEGVYLIFTQPGQQADATRGEDFIPWADVKAYAHQNAADAPDTVGDQDPDLSRRERRQQRRQQRRAERRGEG